MLTFLKKVSALIVLLVSNVFGAFAQANQGYGGMNREIPLEVYSILESYPHQLSPAFVAILPEVVAEYEANFLTSSDVVGGQCLSENKVIYGPEGLSKILQQKHIHLEENDREFLSSISIIKGCEQFKSNNPDKVLNALITKEHKMQLSPETISFSVGGPDICEDSLVNIGFITVARSSSCYRVSRFDSPVYIMNKHGFSGFTTWDVKSNKVEDYTPIYFRSTAMFANVNDDETTNLNFLIISRWNNFNDLEKELSKNFIPHRMEEGFQYLHNFLDRN